jgi:hypothetical protein
VDPLMTLKVLGVCGDAPCEPGRTDHRTVTSALVLMGISPFFAASGPQPTVEDWLADQPAALAGLDESLRPRTPRREFRARVRGAPHGPGCPPRSTPAALLHDFADMLLWCHAPALALRLRALYQGRADASFSRGAAPRD